MKKPLLLVPTRFEAEQLPTDLIRNSECGPIEVCGFGPVVAAARAAQLIANRQPKKVILLGIAGRYGKSLDIGSAHRFDSVSCYGIGIGGGDSFQTASSTGWQQWEATDEKPGLSDTIKLTPAMNTSVGETRQLLTCPAASASQSEVTKKRAIFPDAVAEDMEGFAVAAACELAGVRLTIVRGISNDAGDRDLSRWKIAEALFAATSLAVEECTDTNRSEQAPDR